MSWVTGEAGYRVRTASVVGKRCGAVQFIDHGWRPDAQIGSGRSKCPSQRLSRVSDDDPEQGVAVASCNRAVDKKRTIRPFNGASPPGTIHRDGRLGRWTSARST